MRRIVLFAAGLTLLTCGGCASNQLALTNTPNADLDMNRVAAINKVASDRGVEVHWINYPQRRQTLVAAGT